MDRFYSGKPYLIRFCQQEQAGLGSRTVICWAGALGPMSRGSVSWCRERVNWGWRPAGMSAAPSVSTAGLWWGSVRDLTCSKWTDLPTLPQQFCYQHWHSHTGAVNYSRLKPLRSWRQDCSAEVFTLIKGIDRFPKPGIQRSRQRCFFQLPLHMSHS